MSKKLTLLFIVLSASFLTSCGKNVMSGEFFTKKQESAYGSSALQGYWKSQTFSIDTEGEIDQNIYLQDSLELASSNRVDFDQQLATYDCSAVKELHSVKAINVEIHLFIQYEQYYMIANVLYTTEEDQILRCPGVLGQGNYVADRPDYLFLEDIDLGLNISKQSSGKFALRFLR